MRSRTANWFETAIRYDKTMEDGMTKKVIVMNAKTIIILRIMNARDIPKLIIVNIINMMQMNVGNAKVLIILIPKIINAYQKLLLIVKSKLVKIIVKDAKMDMNWFKRIQNVNNFV